MARPPSRAYQFQKFVRRNRLAFAAIASVTLALVVGLGTSVRMFFKEKAGHTREAALRQRAEEAERETERRLFAALLQQAAGAIRSGEVISLNSTTGDKHILGRHQSRVETVAFSPDGKLLCTGGDGHEVVCWDVQSRQRAFHTPSQTLRAQFHRDGIEAAVVSRSEITFYSVHQPLARRELDPDLVGSVRHGVFSPDGREIYATWQNGIARWRLAGGNAPFLEPLPIHQPARILTGGFSGNSLVLGTPRGVLILPEDSIASGPGMLMETGTSPIQLSPDGRWLSIPKRNPPCASIYRVEPWDGMRFVVMDADIVSHAFPSRSDELAENAAR